MQLKVNLHPNNKHREPYNFEKLIQKNSELKSFVHVNKFGTETIDFFNPSAVKALNKAILQQFYNVDFWDIPDGYLCAPIPGRADYIHYIADLLASVNNGIIPKGKNIKCLDVGVGANCVYPIIGTQEYGWSFVGSDVNETSIKSAQNNINSNKALSGLIEIRHQQNNNKIFNGVINFNERFDITLCNPPFHASKGDALAGSIKKTSNLRQTKVLKPTLNFGGQANELWCNGGEEKFIQNMILESKQFANSCFWFSTLVSKQSNLSSIYKQLEKQQVFEYKTIEMSQGNKISRVVAWTFLTSKQQEAWRKVRWA